MILATSEYCGPCAIIKNVILSGGLDVEVREMSQHLDWFQSSGIKNVPTLVLDDGTKIVGAQAILLQLKKE
jgi:predicted DsbA family dithiol-disulfide isomerase